MTTLRRLLEGKKQALLKRWFELTVDVYPEQTRSFLKAKKDPFANPVGQNLQGALETILTELLDEGEESQQGLMTRALDDVLRIRAVQDISASKSVMFIFFLKQAIREQIKELNTDPALQNEAMDLFDQLDTLSLFAYDIYTRCREEIYRLKATELRDRYKRTLDKVMVEMEDDEPLPVIPASNPSQSQQGGDS